MSADVRVRRKTRLPMLRDPRVGAAVVLLPTTTSMVLARIL
ncbi:hypothetical protein [Streptomyces sp. NPDC048584]